MSQDNVEILRRANEAFNHGDVEGFLAHCSDHVAVEDLNNAPDLPPVAYGKDAARRLFAAWIDAFDDFSGEIEEYMDVDDRHVGCLVHYRGKQRDSGLVIDFTAVDMWEFRGNKLVRGTLGYRDRESALEAVGLSEQAMSQRNVKVVRALLEAWNAGDMDSVRALYDPDVIVRMPEVGRSRGLSQAERRSCGSGSNTRDLGCRRLETDQPLHRVGDRVAVRFIWRGAGRGPEAGLEMTGVHTVRKGRIFGQEFSWDHAEALETLGLSEQAMSQENVEIVRRWMTAMNTRPAEALAAIAEFFDAEIDYYPVRKFPEAQPCHGLEECSQFLARYLDAFSRHERAIQELIAVGDDRVFVRVNMRTEGRGSGVTLEGDLYQCFWLRHGRFFRLEDHLTLSGALRAFGLEGKTLEAAGLSEQAMSQENVAHMKAAFEAWNAGDMDALREIHDPDVVLRMPVGWPERGPFVGRDAVMREFEQLRETFDADAFEMISDFVDVGDRVAVRFIWRGAGQGPESKVEVTGVYTVRNGRTLAVEHFWDHAEALEAVGLSEQDAHADS